MAYHAVLSRMGLTTDCQSTSETISAMRCTNLKRLFQVCTNVMKKLPRLD